MLKGYFLSDDDTWVSSMRKALAEAREVARTEERERAQANRDAMRAQELVRAEEKKRILADQRVTDVTQRIHRIGDIALRRAEERERAWRLEEEAKIQRREDEQNAIVLPIEPGWEWVSVPDAPPVDNSPSESVFPAPQPVNSLIGGIMQRLEHASPRPTGASSTIDALDIPPSMLEETNAQREYDIAPSVEVSFTTFEPDFPPTKE